MNQIKKQDNKRIRTSIIISLVFYLGLIFFFQIKIDSYTNNRTTDLNILNLTIDIDKEDYTKNLNKKEKEKIKKHFSESKENKMLITEPTERRSTKIVKQVKNNNDTSRINIKENENKTTTSTQKLMTLSLLVGKINKSKIYPRAARKKKMEGRVIILLHLNLKGEPLNIIIEQSSGYPLLDRSAIKSIKKVMPFPHNTGKEIKIKIPIHYKLN
jgi:protein TonB